MIHRAVFWSVTLGVTLLLAALIIPTVGRASANARRSVDGSNIRQIGQSVLIYALDNGDTLPLATDVWDYARILANDAGLDVPQMWLSKTDPAADNVTVFPSSVLIPGPSKPRPLDPAFLELKPSIAVALGKLHTRLPATTPIAWTRGLQTDGTWSPHSPYGETGGWIFFLGGNVGFYKNLTDAENRLVRFDGKGSTSHILEALPPGTRIGEYTPTPDEQRAWAKSTAWTQRMGPLPTATPFITLAALWLPFIVISIYRALKKRPGTFTVLLWPVVFTIAIFLILPGCW